MNLNTLLGTTGLGRRPRVSGLVDRLRSGLGRFRIVEASVATGLAVGVAGAHVAARRDDHPVSRIGCRVLGVPRDVVRSGREWLGVHVRRMVVTTRTTDTVRHQLRCALPRGGGSLGRGHGRDGLSGLAWRHRPRGLVWRRRSTLAGHARWEVLLHGLVPAVELELLHGPVRERVADHLERRGFDRDLVDLGDDSPLVLHVHGLVRTAHLDDLHLDSLVEARLEAHLAESPGIGVRHEVDGLLDPSRRIRELVEEVLGVTHEERGVRAASRGEVRLRCCHIGRILRSGGAELVPARLASEEHLVDAARTGRSRSGRGGRVVVGTHVDDRPARPEGEQCDEQQPGTEVPERLLPLGRCVHEGHEAPFRLSAFSAECSGSGSDFKHSSLFYQRFTFKARIKPKVCPLEPEGPRGRGQFVDALAAAAACTVWNWVPVGGGGGMTASGVNTTGCGCTAT